MLRIHILQHIYYEQPAVIESCLRNRNGRITFTHFDKEVFFPAQSDFDWLIIMGGHMSVNDEDEYPWLRDEKHFIRESIHAGKAVLGICLGAQLIAASLGARVYKNTYPEIGWFPVFRHNEAERSAIGRLLPEKIEMFHWHGDTFDLPPNAVHLASSALCRNQAFSIEDRVIGLQFHPEVTEAAVRGYIEHSPDVLNRPPYVQSPGQMLEQPERFGRINRLMSDILEEQAKYL